MARIKGIDIPNEKSVEIALTKIHGIGRSLSNTILKACNIDKNKKAKDLTNDEVVAIRKEIDDKGYLIEGDLRREVSLNIKNKMEIKCYQGLRHIKGLPVRGQKTKSNARTRKGRGKTVANKKK